MSNEYLSLLQGLPTAKEEQKPPVTGRATIDLRRKTGPPRQLASGWIYGIPDVPDQIPDHFYKDVGFNYGRGGGSQLPGSKGWVNGVDDYKKRFASALSNYRTTRKYGGQFVLLPSALWGADGGQAADMPHPGDNDDWRSWDEFLTHVIADLKASDMLEGLVFDTWNEPDLKYFWDRSMSQWLTLWGRTYARLQTELPTLRVSGPSLSADPQGDHAWWTAFLDAVKATDTIPHQWSWHMENGSATMSVAAPRFRSLLNDHGLPLREINVNEYATYAEQLPSGGAWWIAQLEREDAIGLRGNWAMGGQLHDFLAGLVGKPGAGEAENYVLDAGGYYATSEFWVYAYYAAMKGERVETTPTDDEHGDVFCTVDASGVKILAGSRARVGTWVVEVSGITGKEKVMVRTVAFAGGADHFVEYGPPRDLGTAEVEVKDGKVLLEVVCEDIYTAFAMEFAV